MRISQLLTALFAASALVGVMALFALLIAVAAWYLRRRQHEAWPIYAVLGPVTLLWGVWCAVLPFLVTD